MGYLRNKRHWRIQVPVSGGSIELGPHEKKKVSRKIIAEVTDKAYKSSGLLKFIEAIPDPPKVKPAPGSGPPAEYIINLEDLKEKTRSEPKKTRGRRKTRNEEEKT
jgi:hypothetical protein